MCRRAWTRCWICIAHRIQVLQLSKEIDERTKASVDERQREFMLREQMKTIQKELGEGDEGGDDIEDLTKAVAEAGMPPEVEAHVKKELKRLARMPEVIDRIFDGAHLSGVADRAAVEDRRRRAHRYRGGAPHPR